MATDRSRRSERMSVLRRFFRGAAAAAAGGTLLQAATGGCADTLGGLLNSLGQDVLSGMGSGISDLAQVLVIHLFL